MHPLIAQHFSPVYISLSGHFENEHIAPIARRTVLSDDALSVLVPVLEDVVGWREPTRVRAYFESLGLAVQVWHKKQVGVLSIRSGDASMETIAATAGG
jgi:hypothetical protein